MKILLLTDLNYPSDHSFLEEVYTRRFANKGHKITWIMRSCNKNSGMVSNADWNGTNVHLIKSKGVIGGYAILKTAFYTIRDVGKIIDREEWDIIQVRNDPIMGVIAAIKSRKMQRPFVYQYTFYKSEGVLKAIQSKNISDILKGKIGKIIEKKVLEAADLVLPISKTMLEELEQEGIAKGKMYPCTLGVDESAAQDEVAVETIKEKYGLSDFTVAYLGTLNSSRNLKFLIDTFSIVQEEIAGARLLLIGDAPQIHIKELRNYVAQKISNADKVVFTGRIPRADVINYLSAANICVSPIPPTALYRIASPIKVMDYLNASRPIVANKGIIDHEEIINESGAGYCVDYQENEFAFAIIELLNKKSEAAQMGVEGQKYIRKMRGYNKISEDLERIYTNILDEFQRLRNEI